MRCRWDGIPLAHALVLAMAWLAVCLCGPHGGAAADEGRRADGEARIVRSEKHDAAPSEAPRRIVKPLISLWQHDKNVDIAPIVKELGFNTVWTDDPPYNGQSWEETHMRRCLQVPGIDCILAKIERVRWGQTHEGSLKHARWVAELSLAHEGIVGLYLNDFYDEVTEGHRTMEQWREIIAAAKAVNPDLPIWVPDYPHHRDAEREYDVDYQGVVVNLWDPSVLPDAEGHLTRAEEKHAGKTIVAGLYLRAGWPRARWLTEEEFKKTLTLYVDHVNAGKLDGLRVFSAGQLERRPEYIGWAREIMRGLKSAD